MTDSLNLSELQSPSLDFDRQRFLQKWLIQSRPHMGPTCSSTTEESAATAAAAAANSNTCDSDIMPSMATATPAVTHQNSSTTKFHRKASDSSNNHVTNSFNPIFFLMPSNGHAGAPTATAAVSSGSARNKLNGIAPQTNCVTAIGGGGGSGGAGAGAGAHHLVPLGHHIEGRKPKLRRFNSHDTSSNMFSVADFENARLARRNEIEMKQRLQRRMRASCNGVVGFGVNGMGAAGSVGMSGGAWYGCNNGSSGLNGVGGDCSTGDSKMSKNSNDSQLEPLPADLFFDCYSMPSVVRISYKMKFSDETLQSSSSNGSSTATSHSSASATSNTTTSGVCITPSGGGGSNSAGTGTGTTSSTASSSTHINPSGNTGEKNDNNPATDVVSTQGGNSNQKLHEKPGELFLLYKYLNQRFIFHGHNTKTALTNRKKAVLIPQEFPGYFSLVNDKGLPTATQYTSLIQLVRERVFKFIPVDSIPAFTESTANQTHSPPEGCFPIYSPAAQNRPQYVRTTARSGEVYRLIAVYEDGKQDNNAICGGGNSSGTPNGNSNIYSKSISHGREKEKGRYAQLMNDGRKIFYVSLSTKGKFYEVEPGVPVILQNMVGNDRNKKINPDCVYRITELVTPQRELPLNLRYIAGPSTSANGMPENLNITKVTTENIFIACPIDSIEVQRPLQLRKLYVTKEMNLLKSCLGFDTDKSMWSDPNVQSILKFCQFNCDLFMQTVEVETIQRSERSSSKQRGDGLKLLKPLHLPKLLRREKTTIPAHEKEDSIIFLTKTDLANLEAKENAATSRSSTRLETASTTGNRITEKMKVFQSTKKKWFRKQEKHNVNSLSSLDVQVKRMSMERYTDMSKLLQERFGEKSSAHTTRLHNQDSSISEPSCSDTDSTALTTIATKIKKLEKATSEEKEPKNKVESTANSHTLQKSISLQDIVTQRRKQDTLQNADSISETGTDLAELESCGPLQTSSFITEKLYNEFHVRTRQYSKSSSSLNQLLNFSLPQKMQLNDHKRTLAQLKHNFGIKTNEKSSVDFNIGAAVTGRRSANGLSGYNAQNTSLILTPTTSSLIEDELPYSSVRDSLVLSNDDIPGAEQEQTINKNNCETLQLIDYTKENIYAEICHEASAMGGIPSSQTRDTITMETQSTQVSTSDDYGDYASLFCPANVHNHNQSQNQQPRQQASLGNAISRVQINCTASPISYHTVYLGDEPLGEQYIEKRRKQRESCGRDSRNSYDSRSSQQSRDRTHITTVELEGIPDASSINENCNISRNGDTEGLDNIYNTLK